MKLRELEAFSMTHIGHVRQTNQDAVFASNGRVGCLENLYIVADGMGGHCAGDVASSKALDFFREYVLSADIPEETHRSTEDIMREGVIYSNNGVFALSCADKGLSGMGTTFTACSVTDGSELYFAHVGDSRIYVMASDDEITQLTEDHSYVAQIVREGSLTPEQAREHPKRNMLTRALGTETGVEVDTGSKSLSPGTRVLLCSDGLTNMLSDAEILNIVRTGADIPSAVRALVDAALGRGGFDNISVILIRVS